MQRRLALVLLLVVIGSGLTQALFADKEPGPRSERTIPGFEADGSVRLHNNWRLLPAGKQVEIGDFPVNIALHPNGAFAAVLHCGYGEHEIIVLDIKSDRQHIVSRTSIDQGFYGLAFDPTGKTLYASGGEKQVVHVYDFGEGLLSKHREIKIDTPNAFVGGIALDAEGKHLAVAGTWSNSIHMRSTGNPADAGVDYKLPAETFPYGCLFDKERNRLYVSLWGKAKVKVIDLGLKEGEPNPELHFVTASHPTEMALAPDGKQLYVACANANTISVLDAQDGKAIQTIKTALFPNTPNGSGPSSLSITPDGQLLIVANSDNNNLALFNISNPKTAKPLGFIPVGHYPTSVRYNSVDKRIYVANARGVSPKSNRFGPNPLVATFRTAREYIAGIYRGTLSIIPMPTEMRMAAYSKQAYATVPLREDAGVRGDVPKGNAIPGKVGDESPIKHCIYIIKENRTYDQVFGDLKEGNGDANLCIFGEKVTPNAHKLAKQFVLLDNFYAEAEVSAEGHEWSMSAYCTDFVRKNWPLNYRGGRRIGYPAEGAHDEIARPAGGYIWDSCAEAKKSYRSYGEWVTNGRTAADPGRASVKALEGHFDPLFRGYDLGYSDIKRAERFLSELKEFETKGELPNLIIMRLPNDHTSGTRAGQLTPIAYVAQNDLALGMVVEGITKSKFWKETAIFVVEDDAQNGSDHVDAHRTVALAISPYTQNSGVDSTMYSTTSMLRTMELILGLKPMSQFDAAATPMYRSFESKLDLKPYEHVAAKVDLNATNDRNAFGADLSAKMDFSKEDAADDFLLNEVIWRSVRGTNSPMPAPVRSAFVFPKED